MVFDKVLTKIFGTANERVVKRLVPIVAQINALEEGVQKLSDEQLRAKTVEFKSRVAARIAGLTDPDAIKTAERAALDEVLPEAFAVVREAGRRTLGQFHYKVQLMGGTALHLGNIAEMKTGEGKTLVSKIGRAHV